MDEQETQNIESQEDVNVQPFDLKEQLSTVTPLSKSVALILFIALPLIGLLVGYELGSNAKVEIVTVPEKPELETIATEEVQNEVETLPQAEVEESDRVNIGEYIDPDFPLPEPEIVSVVDEGEIFYFRYYGSLKDQYCSAEKDYLDCVSSSGLISGYKLPAEFDPSLVDSLFIDFCNFGSQANQKVDNIYCVGQYSEVIVPREVSELGEIRTQTVRNSHDCTFEIASLALTRAESDYYLLSGEVLNPECKI